MYIVGDKKITLEEAQALADEFNTTVEALAAAGEWKLDEGKPSDPPKKTPTAGQNQTAAGDSSLADTSLESPQIDLYPILNFQQEGGVTAFDEEDINQETPIIPFTEKQKRFDQNQNEWADYNISKQSELDKAQAADATFVMPIDIYEPNTTGVKGATEDDIYNVGWYGGTKTSTSDDIKMAVQDEKLELAEKSAYQINDVGLKAEFVKKYYDANLLQQLGVNINDFEGWLIENNLSQDFENDIKSGLYKTSGFDASYAYTDGQSTSEEMQALFEFTLRNFLDAYLSEDQDRASKRDFVEKYNKNNDFYEGAIGFDDAYNKYLEASKGGVKGLYNWEGLGAYRQQAFPTISNRDKAIAQKQAEEYRRRKAATGLQEFDNTAADFIESLGTGFTDAGLESIRFIETKLFNALGIDDTWVKRDRLLNDFSKDWDVKPGLQYMSASGKKVKINGTNYIVDSDNQIYDIDEGVRVTNILQPLEANRIISASKRSSETDTDISYRGGLITAGNVVGNIGWQILATRGLNMSRAAASEKYIANANGFKNTKDLRKYMTAVNKSGNRRGMNWKGIDKSTMHSFGLKMPFNPAVVDATLFQTFYGAASGYESTIIAAKEAGLSNAEAESLADMASEQMAILYGLTGPINPRIKALNNLDDFLTSSNVVKKAVADYLKAGKKPGAFKEALAAEIGKVAQTAKNFIEEGSKEVVQENIQQMGENLVVNRNINKVAGADILKAEYSVKDFMETSVLSFVTAGAMGSVNLSNIGYTPTNKKRIANLYKMGSDIGSSKQRLQEMVKAGKITEQQSFDILQQATAVYGQANRIPEWMIKSDVDVVQVATLLQEVQNSENLKKRIDSSMHGPIDQSIAEAKQKIESITQEAAKVQITKEATDVARIAGQENVAIYNTIEEMKAAGIDEDALDADGLTEKDGKIVINLEVAARTKAISVSSHELLHRILRSELKNNKAMPKIINEFRNILKNKGILETVEKRMKAGIDDGTYDITFNEDGTVSGNDIDEYLTFFSDAIALEQISFDALQESQWVRIGRLIIDALRTRFGTVDKEFKNGQQVFNFIRDYQKSIQKGKLTSLAKAKAKASEGIDMDTKKSMSAAAGRAKETLDKMQAEGYDPNSLELYEALQGMVGAQLSKYQAKGLQITDEEEAVSDVVSRLYTQRDVNKFDGRGTLYGYLNGRIKFRILDALKANPVWVENFEDIDVDGLEGKATRQIAEEDAEVTISEPVATTPSPSIGVRPEYKSLLKRRVVEPEVVKSIEDKVLRTVRLLKSRIDAKVSKNVTVTPIIKEIKKEMGKQADIDLKTAMGGKKDGELRKFLLRNKAAILENMSTTWLSTAMPIAIQKSVDGVWTSDWKGKKIDREKTTTDLAGRTSGADLVRRLPKAATRISDADFLATILQPDGNPIRGKKESLAKAMAEEISFDIIKQALEDSNHPITQALIENQQRLGVENAENLGPEFVRQSERGNVKYSITKQQRDDYKKSTVAEILSNISERRAFYNKTINETLETELGKGNGIYNLKNEEDLYKFINVFKQKIAPYFPKEFFFRKDSVYTSLIGNADSHGMRNNTEQFINARNIIKAELGLDEKGNQIPGTKPIKWGPPIKNLEGYRIKGKNGKLLTAENILETEEGLKQYMKAGDVLRYNRMVETMHREMWLRFNDIIQNEMADPNSNGEAARFIGTYIASSHSDSNHPQRLGAGIAGYIKGYGTAKNIKKEHATPNSYTGRLLLETAFKKPSPRGERYNFEKDYRFITRNYVLIAFSNEFDAILNKSSLKENMPIDYDPINGNFGERYFNKITKLDPGSLILMSGNSYASVAGVDENGKYISDKLIDFIKKASDERLNKIIENFESKNEIVKSRIASQLAQTALIEDRFEEGQRKYSKSFPPPQVLNNEFNKMLERQSGISANEQISRIRGQIAGKGKGRFKFFIAPGADDFRGLVHYAFAGKGKQGDKDMAFFEENLMRPYFQGIAAIDSMRQQIKREFRVVTKEYQAEYKKLSEQIPGTPFTYDHALRVYMWSSQGTDIPGISAKDKSMLEDIILDNPQLADFGEALMIVGRRETWPKPSEFWTGDSVLADLNSMTEKVGRKEILAKFIENADAIFTEENLNKIEAIKGRAHREAIENALTAMKTGTNRPMAKDRQMTKWLNWINGSTGAIMFFNRRSALLQMLSFTNFINWSDNNPVKAAAAFADQKQYWKDWVMIFNSDKLKERRGGLKQDVSDSEIAQVAGRSKNSPQAILAYLLKIGFTPTQIADSVAIATGGATFYRNRVNTYVKQGKSIKEAEKLAFEDFSKTSDEAQQSSDPALVSKEQRSVLGRLILAFANTPMQYTRLMKKAGLDLINGRGDWKTNVSKIAYYGLVQNFIFSALQSALFALAFDDEEDEEKAQENRDKKIYKTVNSMIDTVLRGSGIYGAAASTIKNTIQTYYAQEEKGYMADHAYTILAAFNISPPIGSKVRKMYNAIQTRRFEKDNMEVRGWAITSDGKLNLGPNWSILGSLVSGGLNVPLDRVVDELSSISEALDARNAAWQRIALALGWKTWDVGARNEEADLIETQAKEARKQKGIEKAKETRRKNKGNQGVPKDISDF